MSSMPAQTMTFRAPFSRAVPVPPSGREYCQTAWTSLRSPLAPRIRSINVRFGFNCTNTGNADSILGLNTLLLTASRTVVPDVVALAATPTQDGILNIVGPTGSAAFGVATTNAGAGGIIAALADTGDAQVPVALTICETHPDGLCKA